MLLVKYNRNNNRKEEIMSKHRFTRKKRSVYKIILPVAVLVIGMICAAGVPDIVFTNTPKVNTVHPATEKYTPNVQCNGIIEFAEMSDITADIPVIIERFNVIDGERVQQGQIIATVNKAATVEGIKELYLKSPEIYQGGALSENDIPQYIEAGKSGVLFIKSSVGELISAGTTIAQIGDKASFIMRAAVSERDISKVDIGQYAEITTVADDTVYSGKVSGIGSYARRQMTGTSEETVVDVTISIDNPANSLKSGFTAEGSIKTGLSSTLLTVPYSAVCQDEKSEYVYVFSNGYAKRRDITTGIELSDSTQVFGLTIADEVIIPTDEISDSRLVIKIDTVAREMDLR